MRAHWTLLLTSIAGVSACASPAPDGVAGSAAPLLSSGYQEVPPPTFCPPADPQCAGDAAYARDFDAVCRTSWKEDFHCVVPNPDNPDKTIELAYELTTPAMSGLEPGTSCDEAMPPGSFPLVMIVPGNGQRHSDYDPLHEVLALNGMMVVTVNPTTDPSVFNASPQRRAALTQAFLGCLLEDVPANPVLPYWNRGLGLIGHSRGGEAVMQLARDGGVSSVGGVALSAVLAIAPSNEESSAPPDSDLSPECRTGTISDAPSPESIAGLMILQGTDDYDTGTAGLAYFDRTGSEHPGTIETPFTRSTVLVHAARHNGFIERPMLIVGDGTGGYLSPAADRLEDATHRVIARAYAHAFFRMYVLGDRRFRGLLTGQSTAPSIQHIADVGGDGPVTILHQFSEGLAAHRVVDHMECADGCADCWETPSMDGGLVTAQNVTIQEAREETLASEYVDARSRALRVEWHWRRVTSAPIVPPRVHFQIPDAPDPYSGYGDRDLTEGGSYRDLRAFTHVSLRAGQLPGRGIDPQILDLRVELTDADGHTVSVVTSVGSQLNEDAVGAPSTSAGLVAWPRDPAIAYGSGVPLDNDPVTMTQTIRLPLSAFCDGVLDLNRIAQISVGPDTQVAEEQFDAAIFLDNVELVAERFGRAAGLACPGTCGNGITDDGEECDDANFDDEDACTAQCTNVVVDTCDGGAPGDPGCECLETPTSEGVAAYFQGGRYCNDPSSICRPSALDPDAWTCESCLGPEANLAGCPCADDEQCVGPFVCHDRIPLGADPTVYPVPGPHPGVCWVPGDIPEGYCTTMNCAGQARVCGQTISPDLPHTCITPDCAEPDPEDACELANNEVCHRDTAMCVPICGVFDPCLPGHYCTEWGECWPM